MIDNIFILAYATVLALVVVTAILGLWFIIRNVRELNNELRSMLKDEKEDTKRTQD